MFIGTIDPQCGGVLNLGGYQVLNVSYICHKHWSSFAYFIEESDLKQARNERGDRDCEDQEGWRVCDVGEKPAD